MKKLFYYLGITSICFSQDVTLAVTQADLNSIVVEMTNTEAVYGFQFDVVADEQFAPTTFGVTAGVGSALGAAFIVQTSNSGRVIGFSLAGASIPAGSGILVEVTWNPIDVEGFVTLEILNVAGEGGGPLSFASGDPFFIGGVIGCPDVEACNFNPEATYDDGTCYYPFPYWEDIDGDGIGAVFLGQYCPEEIPDGAVDIFGDNCPFVYNPDQIDIDGNGIGDICQEGCTDSLGINFDPYSNIDDSSCYYLTDIDPYFQPINPLLPYFPMGIYLSSATSNDTNLRIGDEIAIYDNDLCIGAVQLTTEIAPYLPIIVSQDNPNTPEIDGFIEGDEILYRFWDESEQIEIINIIASVTNGSDIFDPVGFSYVDLSVWLLPGCIDDSALNYNSEANLNDGSCIYPIYGCMDQYACNYNPEANTEDESCLYNDCNLDCGGESFIDECGECVGGNTNMDPLWAMDCNLDCFGTAVLDDCGDCTGGDVGFDFNYNMDCAGICYGISYVDLCEVCDDDPDNDNACIGCTDPWAMNYEPIFTIDDGSCEYPGYGDLIPDGSLNVLDIVALVEHIMEGFQFVAFIDLNYDGFINVIDVVILVDIILHPELLGCTDPEAANYNPDAIYDSGNCDYSGLITDIDGNNYETIVLGDQMWMAENLKVTHYNNGDPISTGFSNSEWSTLGDTETGAYAVYDDDPVNADVYGNLYNWYAVDDDRGICPEGWHVPTDEEFIELELFLGMNPSEIHNIGFRGTFEGSKIAGRADLWNDGDLENQGDFDLSGFSALPGGKRILSNGAFINLGSNAYFWISSGGNENTSMQRNLNYNSPGINRYDNDPLQFGFSNRCIQN